MTYHMGYFLADHGPLFWANWAAANWVKIEHEAQIIYHY